MEAFGSWPKNRRGQIERDIKRELKLHGDNRRTIFFSTRKHFQQNSNVTQQTTLVESIIYGFCDLYLREGYIKEKTTLLPG